MKIKKAVFFIVLIFFCLSLFSGISFAVEPEVYKEVLDNGITVLVKKDRDDIVAVEVFLKVGVMNEPEEITGISGLLQAMLLRGTTTRSARDITLEIESVGGVIQGSANPDYTEFYVLSTGEYFDTGIELMADVIQHPAFYEDEIEKEKNNIYLQMEMLQSKPFLVLYDLFKANLYKRHPYGFPTFGSRSAVESITREDLLDFYKKNYVAKNTVISVAGNVEPHYVVEKIKTLFTDLPDTPPPDLNNPYEPAPLLWREDFRRSDLDSAWLFIGYQTPDINSPDYLPVELAHFIIGGGMNSRMWIKLREEQGLAYDLGSSMDPLYGPGHMITYIATDPSNVNKVRKTILDEIREMRNGNITDEEIETMKTFSTGQYYINEETVKNQAFNLGFYEALGAGYEFYLNYPDSVMAVTKEDIVRVVNEYMTNPVIVVLSPTRP